tara:strand:+ start:698 stop:1546 length:849 start_codon:yes stop_codon:yes gene_type:complete
MSRLKNIYFLFFVLLYFIAGCNTGKLFYDFGDEVASWQLDNYFDLTTQQEEWIEERMRLHLEWHRKEELPRYRNFLIEVQNRAGDGLTMSELDEGYARLDQKRVRTLERLLPDTASFLAGVSPEQINTFEKKMIEENQEMEEDLESPEKLFRKRRERFWEQMEDWFGDFSKDQQDKINRLHTEWFSGSSNPLAARIERRRKSQLQFLAQLRSSPDKAELENWLRRSVINWAGETDSAKQARILRNKKRILQVDKLLTPEQRMHAVRELDEWIEILDRIIMDN